MKEKHDGKIKFDVKCDGYRTNDKKRGEIRFTDTPMAMGCFVDLGYKKVCDFNKDSIDDNE